MVTVARRFGVFLLQLFLVVFGVLTALFFLLRLSGSPAAVIAGPGATPETIAIISENLGLNEPIWVQYALFVRQTAQLDFSTSIRYRVPALDMVVARFPATLLLAACTLIFSFSVALPLGIAAGVWSHRWFGRLIVTITGVAQSVPNFWLGVVFILVFAVWLRWLPTFGSSEPRHLVLPTLTLSIFYIARLIRLIRAGVIETMAQDYIRTAHAKGLSERRILFTHVLRNILIPVVSLLVLDLSFLINGSVVVESLFSYNGIGRLLVEAINNRDYPIVQATVFFVAILIVSLNFASEQLYALIDPRLRKG
jgi:ABC-type dipeptide/oligopeptide/nickel transport system permease component